MLSLNFPSSETAPPVQHIQTLKTNLAVTFLRVLLNNWTSPQLRLLQSP